MYKRIFLVFSCSLALIGCGGESANSANNDVNPPLPVIGPVTPDDINKAKTETTIDGRTVDLVTISSNSNLVLDTSQSTDGAFTIAKSSQNSNAEAMTVSGQLTIK